MAKRSGVSDDAVTAGIGCGCWTITLAINATLGGFASDYVLRNVFGKDIAWYYDVIVGLLLGQVLVPATIVVWLGKLAGIITVTPVFP